MLRDAWENHPGMLVLAGMLGTLTVATFVLALVGAEPSNVLTLDDGVLLLGVWCVLLLAPWCLPALTVFALSGLLRTWSSLGLVVRLGSVVVLIVTIPAIRIAWSPRWHMLWVGVLD